MPEQLPQDEFVAEVIRQEGAALRRFLRARLPGDEVDDAFQGAAMRALAGAESLEDRDRVMPWLYRVFRNAAIDLTRRRARQDRLFEVATPATDDAPDPASLEATDPCGCSVSQSKDLSANYAAVLRLVDVKGLQLREAARELGISVNNATVRLHRARKALKKQMLAHCGVGSLEDCLECRCVYDGCCEV